MTAEMIIDALDSVTWYNGLAEVVLSWKDLKPKHGSGPCPDNYGDKVSGLLSVGEIKYLAQLQVIWMICVVLFGDYGISPRYGWIEEKNLKEFHAFIDLITETQRADDDENEI